MLTRRTLLIAAAATPLAGLALRPAHAATAPVFSTDGVAINGYDAVAYFTESTHVAGDDAHTVDWNGTRWWFASAANRDMFAAAPETYAPQYGGYCAYAMSNGYIAPTDPDAWTVYEGKLYLNYNLSVRERWSRDISGPYRQRQHPLAGCSGRVTRRWSANGIFTSFLHPLHKRKRVSTYDPERRARNSLPFTSLSLVP